MSMLEMTKFVGENVENMVLGSNKQSGTQELRLILSQIEEYGLEHTIKRYQDETEPMDF